MFRLEDSVRLGRAGKRGWSAILPLWPILFGIFVGLVSGGCSSGGGNTSAFSLVNNQGSHPANFLSTHPGFVGSTASECTPCHGDDLTGGIANTSCFTAACHHGTLPGWDSPVVHGASAKRVPGNGGFTSCQICHAVDFTGDGSLVSCLNNAACHGAGVQSPHPAIPWRASSGPTHTDTAPQNASVCAACHFPGSANNPANHPETPAPQGTAAGCFNNTLCHGEAAPHALGADWLDPAVGGANFHGLTAKQDLSFCQTCHGTPGTTQFDGGAASTSCSASTCHTAARGHSIPWFEAPQPFPGYVASHRDSGNRDVACAICHDVTQGRTAPDSAAPSCFTDTSNGTSCHANGPGNANHSVPFLASAHTTVAQTGFDGDCANCHAVTGTSPLSSAPLCTTCHQAGDPLTQANCTSCHAEPPVGSAYPDVAGNHAKHEALAGVTGICTSCHEGLDSGTSGHYDRANARSGQDALRVEPGDAQFMAKFDANSGAASLNSSAFTCSNVSCHGGITTPSWRTGTIDVNSNAGCLQCHALGTALGNPENNSPFSGLHDKHLNNLGANGNALCTDCHDMANGTTGASSHFTSLETTQMEGPAPQTVTFPGLTGATYDAPNQTCTLDCHNQVHDAFSWTGEANHLVPFLDTTHTAVTPAGFSADCSSCHFETGATDDIGPTCTVCHQSGSPLMLANCTSCHADPPTGSTYPDIAGRHAEHNALAGITNICTTCHDTFDSGTQGHYDRANARPGMDALRVSPGDTNFLSTFDANSGAASFNSSAFTCSNVSCHGGITAPSWRTGTINVNFDSGPGVTPVSGCRQCHVLGTALGNPENNSHFSGRHAKHLTGLGSNGNALCTECHDMANGTAGALNHFTTVDTPQMEADAGLTIEPLGAAANYNTSSQSCTVTCHTQSHSGWLWEGPEANHSLGSAWNDPAPGFHGLSAKSDLTDCQSCHSQSGTTPPAFDGGTAVTSCAATACHPDARAHPIPWNAAPETGFPPYTASHRNSGNQSVACAVCHKVDAPEGPGPDSGAPSCFSGSFNGVTCHPGGPGAANHNVPNLETTHFQAVQADFNSDCSDCHSDTGTSPVASAPNCVSCHTNFASSNPLTTKNCTSCHADPPAGSTYPNIAGTHSGHLALNGSGTPVSCSTCHNGLDPGTGASNQQAHYAVAKTKVQPGDAAFLSTYNAQSGASSFNATGLTCTNVSCHGGQARTGGNPGTPINWRTGTINVNTDCTDCHQIRTSSTTDQYTDAFSGDHNQSNHRNRPCTDCHNATALAPGHFTNLATPAFEQDPADTLRTGLQYNGSSCNPSAGGINGCHGSENW